MQNFCRRYRFPPFLKGVIFDFFISCVLTHSFFRRYINYCKIYFSAKFAKKTGKFSKLNHLINFKFFKKWVFCAVAYYLHRKSQCFSHWLLCLYRSNEAFASFASFASFGSFTIPNIVLMNDSFVVIAVCELKYVLGDFFTAKILTIVVFRRRKQRPAFQCEIVAMLPLPQTGRVVLALIYKTGITTTNNICVGILILLLALFAGG